MLRSDATRAECEPCRDTARRIVISSTQLLILIPDRGITLFPIITISSDRSMCALITQRFCCIVREALRSIFVVQKHTVIYEKSEVWAINRNELPNEPPSSLAVYNPALLKKADLIAQFVARRPLLDLLVGELRRSGKTGYQHHLIIGSRGSGKTMLLRRLRYAIEDDAELYSRWLPLVFPEEQYNVSRL